MNLESALTGAAYDAGEYLRHHAFAQGTLEWKGLDNPVTSCDKATEKIIIARLEKDAPGNYVGEEYGKQKNGRERTYYIDPIDGTKQWITRNFLCSVSIGAEENGELVGGVVYDFMRDIMYIGHEGNRYILYQGKKEDFLDKQPLSKTRLCIDDMPELHVPMRASGFHTQERSCSIALSMAELAAGAYDGYIRRSSGRGAAWDVAGGDYLLDPKKFVKLDLTGNRFDYQTSRNGLLFLRRDIAEGVLQSLREHHVL